MVEFKTSLNARERQVLDAILRTGPADLPVIRGSLPGPPSASLVTQVITSLVRKGRVREERQGNAKRFRAAGDGPARGWRSTIAAAAEPPSAALAKALLAGAESLSREEIETLFRLAREVRDRSRGGGGGGNVVGVPGLPPLLADARTLSGGGHARLMR